MPNMRDAMILLDCSRPTVIRWIKDGSLEGVVMSDVHKEGYMIPRASIEHKRAELIADLEQQIRRLRFLADLALE